ncbi:SDR family NAD(P)-dependent oxidoreductase, partial [Roseomonas rosulenta]|uniref:SDR family NAD(P)-dependent oxidoreductase n=1 Tax=Roseomonas rosulenta TaxID=2748667 RepID=UPI001E5820B9
MLFVEQRECRRMFALDQEETGPPGRAAAHGSLQFRTGLGGTACAAADPRETVREGDAAMSTATPDFRLRGCRLLVTGASLGIGRAVALAAAAAGAEVVLSARGRPGLDAVAGEIAAAGGHAVVLPFDAGD